MTKLSDFDLDLRHGQKGEALVEGILNGARTVEVKTDGKWAKTGNLYIEVYCKSRAGEWYLSGLAVSKAELYAFVLEGITVIVPTDLLKQVVRNKGRRITCDIEPNPSRGYLIKVEDLLDAVRHANPDRSR